LNTRKKHPENEFLGGCFQIKIGHNPYPMTVFTKNNGGGRLPDRPLFAISRRISIQIHQALRFLTCNVYHPTDAEFINTHTELLQMDRDYKLDLLCNH